MDTPVECALHPGRPALTLCARCERPICVDDLIDAPVGYQCVDCARSAPAVRRLTDPTTTPAATRLLVLIIVGVALLETTGTVESRVYGLVPVLVGLGDWWRLVTSAFLHAGFLHLAFNGILLWRLGQMIESTVGAGTFLGIAASGVAGGSLGVVGLSWLVVATPLREVPAAGWILGAGPTSITVGASGAVFGLMGAFLVLLRRRGVDPWATPDGSMVVALVLLNLALTFVVPSISLGGHVGGLLAGSTAALLVGVRRADSSALARTRRARDAVATWMLAVGLLAVAATVARALVRALSG